MGIGKAALFCLIHPIILAEVLLIRWFDRRRTPKAV